MKTKKFTIGVLTIIMLLSCIVMLCACNKDKNDFKVPSFSTVGEILDAIDSGTFAFNSATFDIKYYDEEGVLESSIIMRCNEKLSYSEQKGSLFGLTTTNKMYTLPDLADNCVYIIINNFLTNGWSYSKNELTLTGLNESNFASIALKRNLENDEVDRSTPVKVENNAITFETATCKYKIYDFNATKVELEEELKDYKNQSFSPLF